MKYKFIACLFFNAFQVVYGQISISKEGDQLLFKGKPLDNRKYSNIYLNKEIKCAFITFDSANKSYSGCYNFKGNLIIPPIYGEISSVKDKQQHVYFQVSREVKPGDYQLGLLNHQGKTIVPTQFSSIEITNFESNEERILVYRTDSSQKYKYGMYSLDGKELIPAIYDDLTVNYDEILKINYVSLTQNKQNGITSLDGKQIVPTIYNSVEYIFVQNDYDDVVMDATYFRAIKDDLTYLYDNKGSLISGQGWNNMMVEICGGRRVIAVSIIDVNGKTKHGFVNRITGKIITPCKYDGWSSKGNDIYEVEFNGKSGIVNLSGEILEPDSLNFYSSTDSGNCIFKVESSFLKAYLTAERRWIEEKYDNIEEQWPYLILQNYGDSLNVGRVKVYNLQARIFLSESFDDFRFSYVPPSHDHTNKKKSEKRGQYFTTVSVKGQWYTLYDMNKTKIPGNWNSCTYKSDNLFEIAKDGKMGLMKYNGEIIMKPIYHSIADFPSKTHNHYIVKLEHHDSAKSALFDISGKQLTPFDFDDFSSFSNYYDIPFIMVKQNNNFGLIHPSGKKIVDCKYEKIDFLNSSITNSLFVCSQNGKQGLLNSKGVEILPLIYDYISMSDKDEIKLEKDKLYGMCNEKGEIFIPLEYDDSFYFYNGKASVKKGSERFVINKKNERIAK